MWASVRRRVRRLGAEFAPDCVLSYWAYPDGETALRAARLLEVPSAIMVGGSDVLLLTRDSARWRRVVNVFQASDAVVCVGNALREKILALGIKGDKVHVVQRGINETLFTPGDQGEARRRLTLPAHRKMFLWVGRMEHVKGLPVLLDACSRLKERNVGYHLYLVGGGSLRQNLQTICQERGLSERVTFVGPVLHENLVDWYRAADYMVLPSYSEGVPNVLRESLACGTPFVASRVGGIPELAVGPANRLVPPADPATLAEALSEALATPRIPSIQLFQSPSWAESADRLMDVLRPLVFRAAVPVHS
jgi:glycosyltransferase involved in cell wall biosynthesis